MHTFVALPAAVLCVLSIGLSGAAEPADEDDIVVQAARVTPSAAQVAWQRMEYYAFVHFNLPTFLDVECGTGRDDPRLFNPTDFDARQWARVCKDAGMSMIVLVAKHHEGFCLWPSAVTDYSVESSPWRQGRGDVVREVANACRDEGLKFGFYLSPWDAHEPTHGTPAYDEFYKTQLRELLTNYGEITEVWFDGYGADKHAHDWAGYDRLVHELQPNAVVRTGLAPSSLDGVSVRWFGFGERHRGVRDNEWSVVPLHNREFTERGFWRSYQQKDLGSRARLTEADRLVWWPTEFDIPLRTGWFYHPEESPKPLEYLLDVYYKSVGRNATFMLNLSPDLRGKIPEEDIRRLDELQTVLEATFRVNLAHGAQASASVLRSTEGGADYAHDAAKTVDHDLDTYWTADEGETTATLQYDLGRPCRFNRAVLQEYIPVGQRIEEVVLEIDDGGRWKEIARAGTVGHKRILVFDDTTASRVRIRILRSRLCPTLASFGLFRQPPLDELLDVGEL